ncbi:hypothetical protein PR202_ga00030 [Eleusine coracana subsp. coracana]|uniref:Uncharacterized protein n=1 Tax=Eleusine coracana subsp. coracana TaxID=191504 RepID=A0AAV5BFD0_ELECO|nr:hypothetical protein PR202_ga00030 [Eleusine coracana subsp. coracana]
MYAEVGHATVAQQGPLLAEGKVYTLKRNYEMKLYLWGRRASEFDADEVYNLGQQELVVAIFVGLLVKTFRGDNSLSGNSAARCLEHDFQPIAAPPVSNHPALVNDPLPEPELRSLGEIGLISPYDFPADDLTPPPLETPANVAELRKDPTRLADIVTTTEKRAKRRLLMDSPTSDEVLDNDNIVSITDQLEQSEDDADISVDASNPLSTRRARKAQATKRVKKSLTSKALVVRICSFGVHIFCCLIALYQVITLFSVVCCCLYMCFILCACSSDYLRRPQQAPAIGNDKARYEVDVDEQLGDGFFICSLTIGLPPYTLAPERSTKAFLGVSTTSREDAIQKACESALAHLEDNNLIVIKDFNYRNKDKFLRATTFADLLQQKAMSLQKGFAELTVLHQDLLAQIYDICAELLEYLSVRVESGMRSSSVLKTDTIIYVGLTPAETQSQRTGVVLVSVYDRLKLSALSQSV